MVNSTQIYLKIYLRRFLNKIMKKHKTIYVPMGADILHSGHLNIIKEAKKYGRIIIGLFTDKAIAEYKSLPLINYDQRLEVMKNLKDIYKIVAQDTWSYKINLNKIKPDYVIHGDDWQTGIQKNIRLEVIKILKKWNGKLIEVPYTKNSSLLKNQSKAKKLFLLLCQESVD